MIHNTGSCVFFRCLPPPPHNLVPRVPLVIMIFKHVWSRYQLLLLCFDWLAAVGSRSLRLCRMPCHKKALWGIKLPVKLLQKFHAVVSVAIRYMMVMQIQKWGSAYEMTATNCGLSTMVSKATDSQTLSLQGGPPTVPLPWQPL